jgi:hypothetical protein
VTLSVEAKVALPADLLLAWFVPRSPVGLFEAWGPMPGVAAAFAPSGLWTLAGSRRRLRLTDGREITEEVLACELPHLFRYRMSGFAPPLSVLLRKVEGQWSVRPAPGGTALLRWTYVLRATVVWAVPLLWLMAQLAWRGYMRANLRRVTAAALQELS